MAMLKKIGLAAGFLKEIIPSARMSTVAHDSAPVDTFEALDTTSDSVHTNVGSYQTAPLSDYRDEHRALAEQVFTTAAAQLPPSLAHAYKGSYSFFEPRFIKETVAKIIIFEHGLGKVNHDWPIDRDGVYILLRIHGASDQPTVGGVAPTHTERFRYILIGEGDVDAAVREILARVAQGRSVATST